MSKDPAHCGACGVSCSNTQFCTSTACAGIALKSICRSPRVVALLDDLSVDDDAGRVMLQALASQCALDGGGRFDTLDRAEAGANDTGVLEAVAAEANQKRPVAGPGTMLVMAGGGWELGQPVTRYLNTNGYTPIYYGTPQGGGALGLIQRGTAGGADTVVAPYAAITDTHDYFVLQMVVEPESGTPSLVAYGFGGAGTLAAGWYLANRVLPNLSDYEKAWYVYEWTDASSDAGAPDGGDGIPNGVDTYALVKSGP